MDLRLYGRVFWRFRYLVLGGSLIALALGFLAVFRVGANGISYRQQETFRATRILQLTTRNSIVDASQQANLAALAVGYVQVANGDVVLSRARRSGPLPGTYQVTQVYGPNSTLTPTMTVTGFAHTPRQAATITGSVSSAFAWWLEQSQSRIGVSPSQRVSLTTIAQQKPVVSQGRRFTVPIVIVVSVLIAVLQLGVHPRESAPTVVFGFRELPTTRQRGFRAALRASNCVRTGTSKRQLYRHRSFPKARVAE